MKSPCPYWTRLRTACHPYIIGSRHEQLRQRRKKSTNTHTHTRTHDNKKKEYSLYGSNTFTFAWHQRNRAPRMDATRDRHRQVLVNNKKQPNHLWQLGTLVGNINTRESVLKIRSSELNASKSRPNRIISANWTTHCSGTCVQKYYHVRECIVKLLTQQLSYADTRSSICINPHDAAGYALAW